MGGQQASCARILVHEGSRRRRPSSDRHQRGAVGGGTARSHRVVLPAAIRRRPGPRGRTAHRDSVDGRFVDLSNRVASARKPRVSRYCSLRLAGVLLLTVGVWSTIETRSTHPHEGQRRVPRGCGRESGRHRGPLGVTTFPTPPRKGGSSRATTAGRILVAYVGPMEQSRVEMSGARDGRISRIEHYDHEALVRVERTPTATARSTSGRPSTRRAPSRSRPTGSPAHLRVERDRLNRSRPRRRRPVRDGRR